MICTNYVHAFALLGFPMAISELRKKKWPHEFFVTTDVFAVSHMGGLGCEKEEEIRGDPGRSGDSRPNSRSGDSIPNSMI
jgi:hypothetical protein